VQKTESWLSLFALVSSRRQVLDLGSLFALLAFSKRSSFAFQRQQQVKTDVNPDGEVTGAQYEEDGAEVRMEIIKKQGSSVGGGPDEYLIRIVFRDSRTGMFLQTTTTLTGGTNQLGIVTMSAEGERFSYKVVVDARSVPLQGGSPSGSANVTISDSGKTYRGNFDLVTWQTTGEIREMRKAALPSAIQNRIAPFQETLTLIVQRYEKQSGGITNVNQKPPLTFWQKYGCTATCWGTAGIGAAVACTYSAGLACGLFSGGYSAAADYCSKHCPA
jgi:hypothetical protein